MSRYAPGYTGPTTTAGPKPKPKLVRQEPAIMSGGPKPKPKPVKPRSVTDDSGMGRPKYAVNPKKAMGMAKGGAVAKKPAPKGKK